MLPRLNGIEICRRIRQNNLHTPILMLTAKSEENAFEVSRNLLIENSKLYIVKDSILDLVNVNLIFENEKSIIVKGLANGTVLLSKPVPGSHIGMLVKISTENKKQ